MSYEKYALHRQLALYALLFDEARRSRFLFTFGASVLER